ncbi:MAG: hypothetical protein SFY81_15125 [Verrucomicrobiota bacterium]|nr:hypothetical protein [Verrucomicrobiota bacterium]
MILNLSSIFPRRSVRQLCAVALFWMLFIGVTGDVSAANSPGQPPMEKSATGVHDGGGHLPVYHTEVTTVKQFGYSYLTAYMFFLSICLGSLILVILHHLFDAGWSVPVRRVTEQIAALLPWMLLLFIPIALLAPQIYPWMNIDPAADHALHVKKVLFNKPTFYVVSFAILGIWSWMALSFRRYSLMQDKDGSPVWTYKSRRLAAAGVFIFAFSVTLAAIYWMKSLQHQFFSTMYGVYYFAGSTWVALGTIYFLINKFRFGVLKEVIFRRQMHDIGVLLFAFTVFYAYIHFSQYFLIWNAAIPEETFWYVLRERGSWAAVGYSLIFIHFAVPFVLLLRIDAKLTWWVMLPLIVLVWVMHYLDMAFNVMPVLYPNGVHFTLWDILVVGGIGALLTKMFFVNYAKNPPYPIKDPRLIEAVTHQESLGVSPISVAQPSSGGH